MPSTTMKAILNECGDAFGDEGYLLSFVWSGDITNYIITNWPRENRVSSVQEQIHPP